MNCERYLSMLATLPVEELDRGDAREHAAGCRECDRVRRVVSERERTMLLAYGDLYPSVPAEQIAARALVMSRRRRVAAYCRIALGIATVATILFVIVSRRLVPPPITRVSERFQLQCLSPEQAAEVLRQRVQPSTSISFRPRSPIGIINVEASPREMARARALLERYDNAAESQCAVQVTVPRMMEAP